jgi:hypothetical protein
MPVHPVPDYLFVDNVEGRSRDDITAISIVDLAPALDSANDPIHPKQVEASACRICRYLSIVGG